MLYNAGQVANYIINRCSRKEKPISNLKLQKVLYFAWVDYFKQTSRTLFFDKICAWQFGPVVPEIYNEYCSYGARAIYIYCESEISLDDEQILDRIIDKYIDETAGQLIEKTHQPGSAWDVVFKQGAGNRREIPFSLIKEKELGRM